MNTDHPTDWALRYVKAKALREAAAEMAAERQNYWAGDWVLWLEDRADELERR
jgi:hypothetical protein